MNHGELARAEAARALRAYRERMAPRWRERVAEEARRKAEAEDRRERIRKAARGYMASRREPGEEG